MKPMSSVPVFPAAITGCDEPASSPASTWTAGWKVPFTRIETNTWGAPETSLTYTTPPVPSRAIEIPLSESMLASGPSMTASVGARTGVRPVRAAATAPNPEQANAHRATSALSQILRQGDGRDVPKTSPRTSDGADGCARARAHAAFTRTQLA